MLRIKYWITYNIVDKRTIKQIKLESIGTLVAGITHEINTPLTYMKNNLELLELDLLDAFRSNEGIQESIENLKDGINRISNIVEATNEIVKTGSNTKIEYNIYKTIIHSIRIIHNHTKFQMPIFINGELYTPDFKANRHSFKAHIIKEELEQVWIILLNNAYDEFLKSDKHFHERALNIQIDQNDEKAIITFKDNAHQGIDESILDTIFEPFVSTKDYSGIGLGLNIAKKIIKKHKGKIKAYNENDQAVFEVVLKTN